MTPIADILARIAAATDDELPAIVIELAAATSAAAARMRQLANGHDGDDCACLTVEQVAERLQCSTDLVRQRGEQWQIARVLARDSRGRPSRVVYPKALVRQFLAGRPR